MRFYSQTEHTLSSFLFDQVHMKIQRLVRLQTSSSSQDLPQAPQEEAAQMSQNQKAGDDAAQEEEADRGASRGSSQARPSSPLGCHPNDCESSSSSTQTAPHPHSGGLESASKEVEDAHGGGGRRPTLQENGRKAKQKSNCSAGREQEEEGPDSGAQPTNTASWSEMSSMLIGSDYRLLPLSPAMEQRLILQYLTSLGDYQEVRTH